MEQNTATGRRKTAVARVIMRAGSGQCTVNNKPMEQYFPSESQRVGILSPLTVTNTAGQYDLFVRVHGGGPMGQADAVKLGIARVLVGMNEEFRLALRKEGLLTRDPRMVERKKYGHKKARKRFQFSKR
ncbi:MAG TPA: 30S ribosomal protein S9 [Candidatus Kapabacteria bacterium]|nr:30S ribosomal protein S9 [Candidatus Kapabacteria bacterium]